MIYIYIYIYIYIPAENDVIDKQINSNYGFSIGNPYDLVFIIFSAGKFKKQKKDATCKNRKTHIKGDFLCRIDQEFLINLIASNKSLTVKLEKISMLILQKLSEMIGVFLV